MFIFEGCGVVLGDCIVGVTIAALNHEFGNSIFCVTFKLKQLIMSYRIFIRYVMSEIL